MQAPQLPDAEIEAEHARPLRDEEVLPLVRLTHAAQGDALAVAKPQRTRRKRSGFQQPAAAERARQRRQQIKPVGQPKSQTGARRERRGGFRGFVGESAGELKKVEWPGRRQLFSATVVVIIAVAVVGTYLWVADLLWARFVKDILLNF
jgi:preprotein translocase subunit SecE